MLKLTKLQAKRCKNCEILQPTIDQIRSEYNIDYKEIDVDKEPEIPTKYGIMSIPFCIIELNGVERYVEGVAPIEVFRDAINSLIWNNSEKDL